MHTIINLSYKYAVDCENGNFFDFSYGDSAEKDSINNKVHARRVCDDKIALNP